MMFARFQMCVLGWVDWEFSKQLKIEAKNLFKCRFFCGGGELPLILVRILHEECLSISKVEEEIKTCTWSL